MEKTHSKIEILPELKSRLLAQWQEYEKSIASVIPQINSDVRFVTFPIMLDGVIDGARYNVQEKRFDQLEIYMAKGNVVYSDVLSDGVVFCDDFETVIILLE